MARQRRVRGTGPDRGAAAVEFALIVPVLVLILSGIIGFGFVFAQQISLGNAARQAARSLAVNGTSAATTPYCGTGQAAGNAGTQATAQAKTTAATIGLAPNNVVVAIQRPSGSAAPDWSTTTNNCTGATAQACLGSAAGDTVYVRLTYVSTLSLPFFTPSFNLSSIGAFRCEFQS
jgi:Flp pilus assembly protein TadG